MQVLLFDCSQEEVFQWMRANHSAAVPLPSGAPCVSLGGMCHPPYRCHCNRAGYALAQRPNGEWALVL